MSYKIKLDIFEGPLDLLLYLIKRNDLNIYDIPIAKVTEQYIQYLELMRLLDLGIASEFLVMAATLIEIKSKMLLPRDPEQEEDIEEDPRQELIQRLLEYQKYKEAAEDLRKREQIYKDVFSRNSDSSEEKQDGEVFFEASLFDLISAFSKALKDVPKEVFYEIVKDEFTVEEKIHDILRMLLNAPLVYLNDIFSKAKNKLEIVANFLAILELIRLQEIVVQQKNVFGEIAIRRYEQHSKPQRVLERK
ncbi:MAG: segregation/condensation protein A [Candidatus Omnitrophica bacterium]|nr:segregation/condensation protein A [Candidatus Omnitrophota bacterium]